MKTKLLSIGGLLAALALCSVALPVKPTQMYVADYENVLGTSLEIKIAAQNDNQAQRAESAAMNEIDRLNNILSGYDVSSEFERWTRTHNTPVKVSAELFEVMSLFDKWKVQTNGALDASAEVVGKLWKDAAKRGTKPSQDEINAATARVKQQHWALNSQSRTATHLDDAPLMLNSFVKSYIMNKACNAALQTAGTNGIVLNIGGDIVVRGEHTEKIEVSDPKADAENDAPVAFLSIANKTIATSGNYRRGELVNGQWHSHIVDPRTGEPADNIISATVVAENPADAGALATAMNVLKPEESSRLAATVPGAEYMIITADGNRFESKGWKAMEIATAKTIATVNPAFADKTWDPKYELKIDLELKQIEGMRVKRPYVAIWVVDKDKKPVRNIALWSQKPKYVKEMVDWYEAYGDKYEAQDQSVSSTTSATRSAGKYTIKWDGKNDKGELVKRGAYTIMIEVAREHGTHQVMQEEMDFTKSPKTATLAGNPEVEGASLEYVKKTDGQ
jgi:thiamine biosynthesis lipoprotein ApbE